MSIKNDRIDHITETVSYCKLFFRRKQESGRCANASPAPACFETSCGFDLIVPKIRRKNALRPSPLAFANGKAPLFPLSPKIPAG